MVTNCHQLKLQAADGKMRLTDVADTEQLFRLIQSIPSPKAEPFKQWMAQVASQRLDQMQDPEKAALDIDSKNATQKRRLSLFCRMVMALSQQVEQEMNVFLGIIPYTPYLCIRFLIHMY